MAKSAQQSQDNILEQAVQQFIDAQLQGQNPDIDEFVKQYLDIECQIRQRIQNLQQINDLFDCLVETNDGDNGNTLVGHDLVGQTLGDFEILEVVGKGGMGLVFLAHQISLDRKVALKVISDVSGKHSKTLDRFKREAKILAKTSHPNIVPIYEVGEEGPYSYFAMEYVDGTSLDRILNSIRSASPNEKASNIMSRCLTGNGPFITGQSQETIGGAEIDKDYIVQISRVIKDIASALEHTHMDSILHRDIKPSNILLDRKGTPKLVDFGLGKAQAQQSITVTGELFGTPNYMSPEQVKNPQSVDCRSDTYSLAATYYECLTLHPPFDGDTVNETLTKVVSQEVVAPKKYCSRLSNDLNTVLLHALEKAPEDRYQIVADFSTDIENILSFKPITAKRPSITKRAYKTIRRSPLKVALALLLIFTVSLTSLVYFQKQKTRVKMLLEDGDLLLCQAALNTLPWPRIGVETITERAREKYDKVLQIDGNNWWALIQKGIAQLVIGDNAEDVEEALRYFNKAERVRPGFVAIEYLKSKASEQLRKEEAKKVILDDLLNLTAKEAYILGVLALQQEAHPHNVQKATHLFGICVEQEPNFYPAKLAKAFAQIGFRENLNECWALADMKPRAAFGHLLIAYSLDFLGKPEESVKEYEKATELQPWNPKCHYELASTYEKLGSKKKAEDHLLRACQVDTSSWSYLNLSQFYLNKKNHSKSLDACNKALGKRDDCYLKKMLLDVKIECLNELGTVDEIKECLKQKEQCLRTLVATPQWNQHSDFHCELLRFLYANDLKAEARQFFEETTKMRPEFRFSLGRELAQAYEFDNDSAKAMDLYVSLYNEIMLGDFDENSIHFYHLRYIIQIIQKVAQLNWFLHGKESSLEVWHEALAKFPHVARLWLCFGSFLQTSLKDNEGAIVAYRRALQFEKDENEEFYVRSLLATALHWEGKLEDAEQELKALLYRLDDFEVFTFAEKSDRFGRSNMIGDEEASSIYIRLSDVYLAQKRVKEAQAVLEEGLKRFPSNIKLLRESGKMYATAGNNTKAIEIYLKYFKLLPVDLTQGIDNLIEKELLADTVTNLTNLLMKENRADEAHEFLLREKRRNRKVHNPKSECSTNRLSHESLPF
ncbi:MAG: protein kinase [Phycisphaerales bacterium]|nr:MAG: protein kinase [Phycisphaerales bacterium]